VYHAGYLTACHLKKRQFEGKAYVVGPKGIAEELSEQGIRSEWREEDPQPREWNNDVISALYANLDADVGCVIGGYDVNISYVKIAKACNYLQRKDAIFLATDCDSTFPVGGEGRFLPGSGGMVAAIATAADRKPQICGKPDPSVLEAIRMDHPDVKAERTVVFGDRVESDILLANR